MENCGQNCAFIYLFIYFFFNIWWLYQKHLHLEVFTRLLVLQVLSNYVDNILFNMMLIEQVSYIQLSVYGGHLHCLLKVLLHSGGTKKSMSTFPLDALLAEVLSNQVDNGHLRMFLTKMSRQKCAFTTLNVLNQFLFVGGLG